MRLLSLCVHDTNNKKRIERKCVDKGKGEEVERDHDHCYQRMKYFPNDEINSMDSMCWMIAKG